jgi:hypothetical protein
MIDCLAKYGISVLGWCTDRRGCLRGEFVSLWDGRLVLSPGCLSIDRMKG